MINRIGERGVAVETVEEKDPSIFVEGASDPDGEGDGESEIEEIGEEQPKHNQPFVRIVSFCPDRNNINPRRELCKPFFSAPIN